MKTPSLITAFFTALATLGSIHAFAQSSPIPASDIITAETLPSPPAALASGAPSLTPTADNPLDTAAGASEPAPSVLSKKNKSQIAAILTALAALSSVQVYAQNPTTTSPAAAPVPPNTMASSSAPAPTGNSGSTAPDAPPSTSPAPSANSGNSSASATGSTSQTPSANSGNTSASATGSTSQTPGANSGNTSAAATGSTSQTPGANSGNTSNSNTTNSNSSNTNNSNSNSSNSNTSNANSGSSTAGSASAGDTGGSSAPVLNANGTPAFTPTQSPVNPAANLTIRQDAGFLGGKDGPHFINPRLPGTAPTGPNSPIPAPAPAPPVAPIPAPFAAPTPEVAPAPNAA